MIRRSLRLLPALLLVPTALAQAPGWQWRLPAGALCAYTETFTSKNLGADAAQFGDQLPATTLPHVPLLLHSELADDTHLADTPPDLRWLLPYVAFDLRAARPGKVVLTVPRMPPLGDVRLEGTLTAGTNPGEQTFALRLSTGKEIALQPGETKALLDPWRDHLNGTATGTLDLTRTFDPARGLVTGFTGRFELQGQLGPRHANRKVHHRCEQQWTLAKVIGHRAAEFEGRVADAIRLGADWIRGELQNPDDARFATNPKAGEHSRGEGELALALLTLLAAGDDAKADAVVRGFASLRKREIHMTYCLGVAALALEKLYAPPREREDLLSGLLARPRPRTPSDADRALLTEWTTRLLGNRDQAATSTARWNYTGGGDFDNSNSQYALAGLYAAQLCGVKVDRTIWTAAAEHWLQAQCPAEDKGRGLQLLGHKDAPWNGGKVQRGTVRRVEPRGWNYKLAHDDQAYGSMTCAGIASLALCGAALDDGKGRRSPLESRIDDAIRSGFAWLSRHRSVRWNAGPIHHRPDWYLYSLYSLERACELSRVAAIDGWDWYHDGAQVLLAMQRDNGHFGDIDLVDQCFAVLFLKKAQLPAYTGPR